MNSMPVKLILGVLLFTMATYAVPTNAKSAITDASAAGKFLCLVFYEAQNTALTAMSSAITTFKKSSAIKVSVYQAKLNDPANKEVAAKYGIQSGGDLPLVLIFAPNGVITGGFPKAITADQLKQSTGVSDLMLKVLKPLQEQKVVLLAFQNATTKASSESWAGVDQFVTDPKYKEQAAAIKADPSAAGSQELIKQCQLISPLAEATVVVLLPPGRIGKVLTGKVTKTDILAAIQSCAGGSCCPKK